MSVGSRVVFTQFTSTSSPKFQFWREHANHVLGHYPELVSASSAATIEEQADQPPSADDSAIIWYLVSANNRMLARSAQIFRDFDNAVAVAESTITAASRLEVSNVGDESRGIHGWVALANDVPAMTCARWYLSERDRRHSIDLALVSLGTALLRPGARLIDAHLITSVAGAHDAHI